MARGYAPSPYGGNGGGGQGCGRVSGAGPLTVPIGPTGGCPVWHLPRPPTRGAVLRAPFPVKINPGKVARGAGAEKVRGKGPCPHAGAHKKGVRREQTGRPSTTGRHRSPQPLFELRAPPRPSVRRAPLCPLPSPSPLPLLGRGGYGFLAVDGSGADRGNGLPRCGARHAGAEWDAGVGNCQVGQPCGGVPAGGRGVGQYGRPLGQGLDSGHSAGWRGGGICTFEACRRHQVKWRGRGGVPGRGSPPAAPGQRRAPEPGVFGGGDSSN